MIIDEERAPHIKWAFSQYATGDYSLTALLEELRERGFQTIATKKRSPGHLSKSALAELLQDPYYIGIVRFKGAEYPGTHQPLIDESTFQRVQQVLAGRRLSKEKHWRHGHYLKGTVYCGFCGSRLQFTQVRGHGGVYEYFVCSKRHAGDECEQRYIKSESVEAAVARYFGETVRFDADRVKSLEPALVAAFELLGAYHAREAKRLVRKIASLSRSNAASSMPTLLEQSGRSSFEKNSANSAPTSRFQKHSSQLRKELWISPVRDCEPLDVFSSARAKRTKTRRMLSAGAGTKPSLLAYS